MEDATQLMKLRREKLKKLAEMRVNAYPYSFDQTHSSQDILNNFTALENKSVSVSGRIMSIRLMGKAAFFHLQDVSSGATPAGRYHLQRRQKRAYR